MSSAKPPSFVARLRRFTTWNVGQQVLLAVLSLVATPVLYHRLGDTAYGILSIVTLLASQLAILEFGFGHATIRWVALGRARADDEAVGRTLGTSFWVFAGTAVAGGAILFVAAEPLVERFFNVPPEARATAATAVRVGSVFFVASVFGNLLSAIWQGLQRFGPMNVIAGASSAVQVLGSLAIVLAGHGVVAVVVWSSALGMVALAVNVLALGRALPGMRWLRRPDVATLREMGRFGFLLMVAGALTQVVLSGGPLVLGHFVAIGALPFFTVPLGLFQRLNRMAYGLAAALFPLVSELQGRQDSPTLEKVFVSGTHTLLLAGVSTMAPAVLLSAPFLSLWMGPEFAGHAGPALELLFAAFAVALTAVPSIEVARGTGRPGLLVGYTAIQAAVTLAGVALLGPAWGASGAAAAFLAAHVAGLAFLLVAVGGRATRKVVRPTTVLLAAAGIGAAVALLSLTSSAWLRLGSAVALGPALALATVRWASTAEERQAIRRILGRS